MPLEPVEKVRQLVEHYGIPRVGASQGLVNQDPEIQGPRIFKRSCASCHSYLDERGHGIAGPSTPGPEPAGAAHPVRKEAVSTHTLAFRRGRVGAGGRVGPGRPPPQPIRSATT